jgi:hypothetical protein
MGCVTFRPIHCDEIVEKNPLSYKKPTNSNDV